MISRATLATTWARRASASETGEGGRALLPERREGLRQVLGPGRPCLAGELASAAEHIHRAAADIEASTGVAVPYTVGTMVETPRAALIADQLAGIAQFLSFGTNDLTQLTYGFSRDDVEAQLLTAYIEQKLLPVSPFASLDLDGVGALISTAITRAPHDQTRHLRRARR
jgi:pyruvate, orthophosphate dikinase